MTGILEMRLEDCEADFDQATRAVYEHFQGRGDPRIGALVERASQHDLGSMAPDEVAALYPAVSDAEQESAGKAEMERLFRAGDACMRLLVHQAGLLGYSSSSLF